MKIVSYNVALCPVLRNNFKSKLNNIIDYINQELNDCDVVCLQEATGSWNCACIPDWTRILSSLSVLFGNCLPCHYSSIRKRIIAECKNTFPYSFESTKLKRCNMLCCSNECYDSGLLILSKHPILNKKCIEYAESIDVGTKGMLKCKINDITVVNTHLIPSNYGEKICNIIRRDQIDTIRRYTEFDYKIIIAGDLNIDRKDYLQYNNMKHSLNVHDASERDNITYWGDTEIIYDDQKLDYFLVRGIDYRNYKVIESYISDHKPIVVEISNAV